jgi:hypothetical protein
VVWGSIFQSYGEDIRGCHLISRKELGDSR